MDFAGAVVEMVLDGIVFTTKKIISTVAQMKVNKAQSTRLVARVNTITMTLQAQNLAKLTNPGVQVGLQNFLQFLKECEKFLAKFTKAGWIARIRAHSNHAQQFEELNINLDRHLQDLSFGLQVNMAHRNLVEDKIDAQNDLLEINRIVQAGQMGSPSNPSVQPIVNTTRSRGSTGPVRGASTARPRGSVGGANLTRPVGPTGDKPSTGVQTPKLDKNCLMPREFLRPSSRLHQDPCNNCQRQPQQPFHVRPPWHNSALSLQQAGHHKKTQYPHAINQVYP